VGLDLMKHRSGNCISTKNPRGITFDYFGLGIKSGKLGGQEELDQYPENTVEEIPEVTQNQKDNEWLDETSSENAVDIVTPLKIKDQDNEIEGGAPFSLGRIDLLVFKNVDLEKMSLPLLTVVLALADGLNPCAMWVLLFLISL